MSVGPSEETELVNNFSGVVQDKRQILCTIDHLVFYDSLYLTPCIYFLLKMLLSLLVQTDVKF